MPQRYKLRLGDGTSLMVDEAGLNTWQTDPKAMVQAATGQWQPLKFVLARQQAAAKYAAQSSPLGQALPLVPPKPRETTLRKPTTKKITPVPAPKLDEPEPAPILDTFSASEAVAVSTTEASEPHAWADEPEVVTTEVVTTEVVTTEAAPIESVPVESVEAIRMKPVEDVEPERFDPPWTPDPIEPTPVSASPSLQVLADDPTPYAGYTQEPSTTDDPPPIPLKPRDDPDEVYTPEPRVRQSEPDDYRPRRQSGFISEANLVQAIEAFAALLATSRELLERAYRTLRARLPEVAASLRTIRIRPPTPREEPRPSLDPTPALQVLAEDPAEAPAERLPPEPAEIAPVIHVKQSVADNATIRAAQDAIRGIGNAASEWVDGVKEWVERARQRPSPARPSTDPDASAVPSPPPRVPLNAPPPISEVPVLRLAKIEEPKVEEDLFDGELESRFPDVWFWTKRVVLLSVVVGVGILATLRRDAWLPQAAQVGGKAFTGTQELVRSVERRAWERQALQVATAGLPHLAPETIRLVLTHNSTVGPDPPELFQRAGDAAERGLAALTPDEAQELQALLGELLDNLTATEAESVREYGRVRARRASFPFEDRRALELFARGVRALPAERIERLQALLGKAIAAGLSQGT